MSPVPGENSERSQVQHGMPKIPLENLNDTIAHQIELPREEGRVERRESFQALDASVDAKKRKLIVAGAWGLLVLLAIFAANPAGGASSAWPIVASLLSVIIFLLYQVILFSPWKRKLYHRHLQAVAAAWIWLLSFLLSMFSSPGRQEVMAGEDAWRMREDPGNSTAALWILCVLFATAFSVDLEYRAFTALGQVIAFQHLLISAFLPAGSLNDAPPNFGGVYLGLPPWLVPSLQLHVMALGLSLVRLWQDQDKQVRAAVNDYLEGKEVPTVLAPGSGGAVKTRIEMITEMLDGEIDFLHELLQKVANLASSNRAHVDWMRSVDFLLDLLTSSLDVLKQTQINTDVGEGRDLQDQLADWIGAASRQQTIQTPRESRDASSLPASESNARVQLPGQIGESAEGSFHSGAHNLQQSSSVPFQGESSLQMVASQAVQESSSITDAAVAVEAHVPKDLHVRSTHGVGDWSFDALNVAAQHQSVLKLVGMEFLSNRPMLPKEHLPAFLETLESRYDANNPYHSNIHAADMTNAVYFMFENCGLQERVQISDDMITCMYLAALGHDVGHPGYNNLFLVNSRHEHAITYSDRSVLENFHAAELTRLLSGQVKGVNFLGALSDQQQKQERFWMTTLILNTDMSKLMQDLSSLRIKISAASFSMEDTADQQLVMGWLFRSADIGHSAKPWKIHEAWSMRVVQEFHDQGDSEIRLGLPVSPLCDRTDFKLGKSQAGFLQFVCLPTFAEIKNLEEMLCEEEGSGPGLRKQQSQDSKQLQATNSMLSPPSMSRARTERPSQLGGGQGRRRSIAQLASSKSNLEMCPSPQATVRTPATPAPNPLPQPQTPESTPRNPLSARRRPSQPAQGSEAKVAPEPTEKRRGSLGSSLSGRRPHPKVTKGSTSSSLGSKLTTRVIKTRVYLQCKENMETWQKMAADEERAISAGPSPASKGSASLAPMSSSSEGEHRESGETRLQGAN